MMIIVTRCMQLFTKLVNSVYAMTGIAMIMYSLWMIRVLQYDHTLSRNFSWFINTFIAIGIILCAITCLGYVAADTANLCYLSCYLVIALSFLLLETLIIADIMLNADWEKDFPVDPSGMFDDFKKFIKSNIDVLQWVIFSIILSQGLSLLSATVLKFLVTQNRMQKECDYDYDHVPRLQLLSPNIQSYSYIIDEPYDVIKNGYPKVIVYSLECCNQQNGD